MTVYLVRKKKNRKYKSEDMVFALCGKQLVHDEKGAPCIEGGFVSVTDTKNWWACAFSDVPLGIDMEEFSRDVSPAAVRKLHKEEQEYLGPLSPGSGEWKEEFLSIWTKKESYVKYKGKGLSFGLSSFSVLGEGQKKLETQLFGLRYKGLVFGATEPIEIKEYSYDAPMEKSALDAGADILDMFGCSANTLKSKLLSRGYGEEEASEAVGRLKELGYLNDAEYGGSLGRKYAARGYSSKRIEYELLKKGLEKEDAAREAALYREGDRERASEAAEKVFAKGDADEKTKAKVARKLSSLGYDAHVVYDIIQKLD